VSARKLEHPQPADHDGGRIGAGQPFRRLRQHTRREPGRGVESPLRQPGQERPQLAIRLALRQRREAAGDGQDQSRRPLLRVDSRQKNKLTGFCLTGSTQTGIYSTTCDTSDPHQQWLWNESDSSASFVHLSNGHCLAEPAPDQPTTVECDGSTDQHWRIG
jgi:hypothetical protein